MNIIKVEWTAPNSVTACVTTKNLGNIALHTNDNLAAALENRKRLIELTKFEPIWLKQNHSNAVLNLDQTYDQNSIYDASFTTQIGMVCAVMTADCVPILISDIQAITVGAIHAGWRGLENDIISQFFKNSLIDPQTCHALIGPAICQTHFAVGIEVYNKFIKNQNYEQFFLTNGDKYLMNAQQIAKYQLLSLGVQSNNITIINECTFEQTKKYYSYRQQDQGRFASLIWKNK